MSNTSTTKNVSPTRLEAFSDGVIAIIITVMVLEIKPPHDASIVAWKPMLPTLAAYVLSFAVLAIYWNNHHHLLRATKHASAGVMWANTYLLFWLSLIPIVTAWLGQNVNQTWPVVAYSFVALMSGLGYLALTRAITTANPNSGIADAIGKDKKGMITQVLYVLAFIFAFIYPYVSYFLFAATALIWMIPDRKIINA